MCPRDCRTAARWSRTRSWVAFSRTCWSLSRRCSRVIFDQKGKLCRFFCFWFCFLQDYDSVDLADFAQTIMKGCDINRDGKISKKVKIHCEVFWIASNSQEKTRLTNHRQKRSILKINPGTSQTTLICYKSKSQVLFSSSGTDSYPDGPRRSTIDRAQSRRTQCNLAE